MTPDRAASLANDIACAIATLQEVADELTTAYPDGDYGRDEPQDAPPPKRKPVTLEEVRAALSAKAAVGKREEVKALLAKYGAAQLSAVTPEQYAALLADAEGL
jgi:3-methyladenine DNA glycosylase Tag